MNKYMKNGFYHSLSDNYKQGYIYPFGWQKYS